MRLIAQYRNYDGPTLRPEYSEPTATGVRVHQSRHWAGPFVYGDVTQWEIAAALDHWKIIRGLVEGEDPRWRLSGFDTDIAAVEQKWTQEQKREYEDRLSGKVYDQMIASALGSDYIVVEKPAVPKPWPTYDNIFAKKGLPKEAVVEKIAATVRDLGLDPNLVAAYERDHLNRADVIAALTVVPEEEELIQA